MRDDPRVERNIGLKALERIVSEDSSESYTVAMCLLKQAKTEIDSAFRLGDLNGAKKYLEIAETSYLNKNDEKSINNMKDAYQILIQLKLKYGYEIQEEKVKVEEFDNMLKILN